MSKRAAASRRTITRRQREQELADARAMLATPAGRRFVWWLLGAAGTYSTSYAKGDATHTAFLEGNRNVGIMLERRLTEAAPRAMIRMQEEALAYAEARRGEVAAAASQPDDDAE